MIEDIFGEDGWLAQHLSNYRFRPGQMELAKKVAECMREGTHLLAEGPTGTGKSMAYGIPAALESLETGKTVMIATANITLQEQLYDKDLPLIADLLDGKFEDNDGNTIPRITYKLVKGMSNYICLDKLSELEDEANIPSWLDEVLQWVEKTDRGDKNELDREMGAEDWSMISSTSEECTRSECHHYEDCYVYQARRMEEAPNLVVTNYHMLYTDLLVREATAGQAALLPDYETLVMDEAHEAVDIAMNFYGYELSASKIKRLGKRLLKLKSTMGDTHYRAILRATEAFFRKMEQAWKTDIIRQPLGFDGGLVKALKESAYFIAEHVKETDPTTDAERRTFIRTKALVRSFHARAKEVETIAFGVDEGDGKKKLPKGTVYYMEKNQKGVPKLCCKVIEVQGFLRMHLFDPKTVIALSATLSTGGNFEFVAGEMGLEEDEYEEKIIDSPFSPDRLLLVVPNGIPSPKQQQQHMDAVAKILHRVVSDIGGRTMALFTSYRALAHANKQLRGRLNGIQILMQGEYTKPTIIRRFKENCRSVILATASFWQGVDIPGQDLSCLFIDKFPFMPPTDPVLKYLEAEMEAEGGSVFFDYSVPKAVLTLKQGVGRLIRTEDDYGVVVFCDHRIDTTGYGKQFLKAFPKNHYKSEDGDIGDVKGFLDHMEKKCRKMLSTT